MLGDSASKTIFFHKMNLTESYLRSDADFLAGQEKSNLWQFLSPLSIHSLSFFQLTFNLSIAFSLSILSFFSRVFL